VLEATIKNRIHSEEALEVVDMTAVKEEVLTTILIRKEKILAARLEDQILYQNQLMVLKVISLVALVVDQETKLHLLIY
jgi:hypothetical protein